MKKTKKLIILLVLAVILGTIIFYYTQTTVSIERYIKGHAIARQKNNLSRISQEVQSMVRDFGPYKELEEIIDKLDDAGKQILIGYGYNPEEKMFYDKWDTPIKLKQISRNEYLLISAGPNKKYEDGRGDDIIFRFNPLAVLDHYNELLNTYEPDQ
jgi:hypothetical protein